MAGKNTIEAKLRIAADFADAVRDLKALRAEMKAAGADAKSAGGDATGAKAVTQAQKDSTAAARAAATEQRNLARETAEIEKKAAKEAAAEVRKQKAAEAEAARKAAAEARKAAAEQAATAKAAAKAARLDQLKSAQLAPQVTDIVTGLASGQSPLLVAIQQGGQLRDVFGGAGNAAKALLSVFTPMRIAVGGVVAVAALLAKAFFEARAENDELQRSINTTGNVAATSVGQVNQLAQKIATQQNVSISSVRETLNELLKSGDVTSTTFEVAGRAVTALSRATGQSAAESGKSFEQMGRDATGWATRMAQQYNAISAATVQRVRELQSEGKAQEALRLALDEFSRTMESRVVQSTNSVERAWQAFGRTLSNVWESWKRFFDDATIESQQTKMRKRIDELERALSSNANLGSMRSRMRAELDGLKEQEIELNRLAIADQNRRDAGALAAQDEQDKLLKQSKTYQDAVASLSSAEAQKRLTQQIAALEAQRSAVELDHKKGLLGELDYNVKLNGIEQQRLQAQAATIERQIEIARQRSTTSSSPEEKLSSQAAIKELEASLVDVKSRIAQTISAARGLVEDDALKSAREKATAWEAIWTKAAQTIRELAGRNAVDRAAGSLEGAGPDAKAQAAAAAATANLIKQRDDLQRELNLQLSFDIPEGAKAELRQQLADLARESATAIESAGRRAQVESLRDQAAQLQASIREREAEVDQALANGAVTSAEAERQKLAIRAQELPQLTQILELLQSIAATDSELAAVSRLRKELQGLSDTTTEFERTMRGGVASSFSQAFQDFATGAKTAGQAFRDFLTGVLKAALNFIAQRLGEQLAKSLIPSGAGGGSSGWVSALGSFITNLFHGGGVVGGIGSMTRAVSPMVFATAARYHSGGMAGLAPDEVPAVLRKGEEVLTADDPRHRNNGGGAAIGNMTVNVSVSSDSGTSDSNAAGQRLARAIKVVVANEVTDMMRPGGLLAGRKA